MIRYPGSKDKITAKIMRFFPHSVIDPLFQGRRLEYREPFFGGGAVGFDVLRGLPSCASVWINDMDYGLVCLWNSVRDNPDELIEMVKEFKPTTDAFYQFKEEDGRTDLDPVLTGFRKFALHQTSFSGLGAMAGGPLGGRKQSSEYNVDCRWHATRHCLEIKKRHRLLKRFAHVMITRRDFSEVINNAPQHAFIYADPPYYEKGGQLYKYNMSNADHCRLSECLRKCQAKWVLSYDDHPVVRDLYSWADVEDIALTYTIARAREEKRRKNSEVVIKPKQPSHLKVVA